MENTMKIKDKSYIWVVFACVFAVMLIFNLMTPMISDDYAHFYAYRGEHPTSLSEIVKSLPLIETNSRWIPHFFVFVFLSLPRPIFAILNAGISTAILYLIFRFFRTDNRNNNLILLLCAVAMIWYFTPGFGQIYLWLTGACNYSWGLCLDLLLIYPFLATAIGKPARVTESNKIAIKLLYACLAFVVGAYSENGGASNIFAMALFILLIWIKNKKFPTFFVAICFISCCGFAALMLAPKTSGNAQGISVFDNAKNCAVLLKKFSLVLLVIYAITAVLAVETQTDVFLILSTLVLVLAGLVSIGVFVFAKYLPERSFMIITAYTIVAILTLMSKILNSRYKVLVHIFMAGMAVVFTFSFILGAGDIFSLYSQASKRSRCINEAIASKQMDVELETFKASTMYPAAYYEEMSDDSTFWYNDLIAKYYGLNSVTGIGIAE